MFAAFDKWKKVDDLPPIVDEIDSFENKNIYQVNQIEQGTENILIFLDLKEFGVEDLQAEIIDMQQVIQKFFIKIGKKYFAKEYIGQVQMIINGISLKGENRYKSFKYYENIIKSNTIIKFKKKVKKEFGGYHERLVFSYQGKDLKPYLTFQQQDIRDYSVLKLTIQDYGGCFPGNAPIKLFNGTAKLIRDIELGDIIQCYDFEQLQFKQSIVVSKYISSEKKQLIEIITQNGRIVCTPNHPVYTQNGWKALRPHSNICFEKLSVSDLLLNSSGQFVNIIQINEIQEKEVVYNITTQYPNNFIAFDILVHNMNRVLIKIDGKNEEFEVLPYFLIKQIKIMIEEKKGIPISSQQLYYQGILMKDEFALEDYHVEFLSESEKNIQSQKSIESLPPLVLKVNQESQGKQQEGYQNINNKNTISIISNNQEYKLFIKKDSNQIQIRDILETASSKEDIQRSLILCNGEIISLDNNNIDLSTVQSIFLIDQQSGGTSIKYTYEINNQQLENLSQLQDSLKWLNNSSINEFIQYNLEEINGNQQKKQYYQQTPLHCIIAIRLYTSNLIYRKLNNDLRNSDYQRWKKYLKYLMEGFRYMNYYKGVAYRGIRDYQNTTVYQEGKIVQWSEISSVSQKWEVAQRFSNQKGMIVQVELISAKDISKLSIFEGEQEVIMYPFSTFAIEKVQVNPNQPHVVTMRELPLPRSHQVLLWVDDNPENNYQYALDLERQNKTLSVIFCTSTKDAIFIIQKYKWMIYLQSSQFRIVSDMVRMEDGQMKYNAGIELLRHLYQEMKYKNKTLIFCGNMMRAQEECQKQNILGDFEITNNQSDLMKFLQFE